MRGSSKLTFELVRGRQSESTILSIISCKRIVILSYFLRVMLVFVRGVGAVCVYDQPGDEVTLVKQMVSDRTLPEYHIDLVSESSGVALLEPSSSIRRFPRFLQNSWQKTSGLAMLLVRACGAETFVPWTLLERAGASCVFMLELNFHSGSSIYSSQWFACLASLAKMIQPLIGLCDVKRCDIYMGSETSGLAMLLVRACGAETFVPWTLLERAGVQRQTVLATLRVLFVNVRAKLP
ncbi:hypothetical protein DY000_02007721 [Brassica cretica]|uniref:Uncharacterized protein n=1 Tax=Brassica cretica TaxID=69181 RepID=A0ABQ7CHC3_BRACR|nr:hypothetical protein DY000_02007721 [Brassica cretica]